MLAHTANLLTLLRILLIPILVFAFYQDESFWRFVGAFIFIIGCLTDYLDGYIARAWSQTSRLGQFLDPVADKLLVAATLLMLAGFGRISKITLIPAAVIVCREILVSGLREHLSAFKVTLKVSRLAKWKTAVQMASMCCLLVGDALSNDLVIRMIGEYLLWVAAFLTSISGYRYIQMSLRHF